MIGQGDSCREGSTVGESGNSGLLVDVSQVSVVRGKLCARIKSATARLASPEPE